MVFPGVQPASARKIKQVRDYCMSVSLPQEMANAVVGVCGVWLSKPEAHRAGIRNVLERKWQLTAVAVRRLKLP